MGNPISLAEHRSCASHVHANFGKNFPGAQLKLLFWRATKAESEAEFERALDKMYKVNREAANYLKDSDYRKWARAFYSPT